MTNLLLILLLVVGCNNSTDSESNFYIKDINILSDGISSTSNIYIKFSAPIDVESFTLLNETALGADGEIPKGFMPKGYTDGFRSYTPKGLIGFNFTAFVYKIYIKLLFRHPTNIPFILSIYSPKKFIYRVISNIHSIFLHTSFFRILIL